MDVALLMMAQHEEVRALLTGMVSKVFPLEQAAEALEYAKQKGVLKVQVSCEPQK